MFAWHRASEAYALWVHQVKSLTFHQGHRLAFPDLG
jgi:hypothetical protein